MGNYFGLIIFLIIVAAFIYDKIKKNRLERGYVFPGERAAPPYMLIAIPAAILFVIVVFASIVVVQPGHALVNFNIFRGLDMKAKPEGIYLINPVTNRRFIYNVRSQIYTMSSTRDEGEMAGDDSIIALSSDGLEMRLDITVRFRPDFERLAELHKKLGPNYQMVAIRPKVREAMRSEFAQYEATESYSFKRIEIQSSLNDTIRTALEHDGIVLDEFLLRNIHLPDKVKAAIEEKKSAQQEAERMQYILEKEEQEAERKRYCETLQTNLAQLQNNPRVRVEENGEVRRLKEEERQSRIAETKQKIEENCKQ